MNRWLSILFVALGFWLSILLVSLLFSMMVILIILGCSHYSEKSSDNAFIKNVNSGYFSQLPRTAKKLNYQQEDSLSKLDVTTDKIEVFGTGYTGYDFYIWHQPNESGSLYIKAFEISRNQILSEQKLLKATTQLISISGTDFRMFKSRSVIDEGPLGKYYPVRFEVWFKPEGHANARKLTQKEYLIDGWDR